MGNQLGVVQDVPSLLIDLSGCISYRRSLGGGKLLKTLECLYGQTVIVVKARMPTGGDDRADAIHDRAVRFMQGPCRWRVRR
jgi:hypothetical protein